MFVSFLIVLTCLCWRRSQAAEFKKHVQNSVYPNDIEPPIYNIDSWVKQLHLQQCAIVEIGDRYNAIFVETRPRKYDGQKGITEYFLGICDDDTLQTWPLCSDALRKKRYADCTFKQYNLNGARVHRRLCDVSLISRVGRRCDCNSFLSESKLYPVTGFPTCFKAPLPDSLCGENNVCGLSACIPATISRQIHTIICNTKCIGGQPFCERIDNDSSKPRLIRSFWTDWSNPSCTDLNCLSQFDEAICINRETGGGDIDCLGPGTACCSNELHNCKCHIFEEDGAAKIFRTFSLPTPEIIQYMTEEDFINSIPLHYIRDGYEKHPYNSRTLRSNPGQAFKKNLYNVYDHRPVRFGNTMRTHKGPMTKFKAFVMKLNSAAPKRSIDNSDHTYDDIPSKVSLDDIVGTTKLVLDGTTVDNNITPGNTTEIKQDDDDDAMEFEEKVDAKHSRKCHGEQKSRYNIAMEVNRKRIKSVGKKMVDLLRKNPDEIRNRMGPKYYYKNLDGSRHYTYPTGVTTAERILSMNAPEHPAVVKRFKLKTDRIQNDGKCFNHQSGDRSDDVLRRVLYSRNRNEIDLDNTDATNLNADPAIAHNKVSRDTKQLDSLGHIKCDYNNTATTPATNDSRKPDVQMIDEEGDEIKNNHTAENADTDMENFTGTTMDSNFQTKRKDDTNKVAPTVELNNLLAQPMYMGSHGHSVNGSKHLNEDEEDDIREYKLYTNQTIEMPFAEQYQQQDLQNDGMEEASGGRDDDKSRPTLPKTVSRRSQIANLFYKPGYKSINRNIYAYGVYPKLTPPPLFDENDVRVVRATQRKNKTLTPEELYDLANGKNISILGLERYDNHPMKMHIRHRSIRNSKAKQNDSHRITKLSTHSKRVKLIEIRPRTLHRNHITSKLLTSKISKLNRKRSKQKVHKNKTLNEKIFCEMEKNKKVSILGLDRYDKLFTIQPAILTTVPCPWKCNDKRDLYTSIPFEKDLEHSVSHKSKRGDTNTSKDELNQRTSKNNKRVRQKKRIHHTSFANSGKHEGVKCGHRHLKVHQKRLLNDVEMTTKKPSHRVTRYDKKRVRRNDNDYKGDVDGDDDDDDDARVIKRYNGDEETKFITRKYFKGTEKPDAASRFVRKKHVKDTEDVTQFIKRKNVDDDRRFSRKKIGSDVYDDADLVSHSDNDTEFSRRDAKYGDDSGGDIAAGLVGRRFVKVVEDAPQVIKRKNVEDAEQLDIQDSDDNTQDDVRLVGGKLDSKGDDDNEEVNKRKKVEHLFTRKVKDIDNDNADIKIKNIGHVPRMVGEKLVKQDDDDDSPEFNKRTNAAAAIHLGPKLAKDNNAQFRRNKNIDHVVRLVSGKHTKDNDEVEVNELKNADDITRFIRKKKGHDVNKKLYKNYVSKNQKGSDVIRKHIVGKVSPSKSFMDDTKQNHLKGDSAKKVHGHISGTKRSFRKKPNKKGDNKIEFTKRKNIDEDRIIKKNAKPVHMKKNITRHTRTDNLIDDDKPFMNAKSEDGVKSFIRRKNVDMKHTDLPTLLHSTENIKSEDDATMLVTLKTPKDVTSLATKKNVNKKNATPFRSTENPTTVDEDVKVSKTNPATGVTSSISKKNVNKKIATPFNSKVNLKDDIIMITPTKTAKSVTSSPSHIKNTQRASSFSKPGNLKDADGDTKVTESKHIDGRRSLINRNNAASSSSTETFESDDDDTKFTKNIDVLTSRKNLNKHAFSTTEHIDADVDDPSFVERDVNNPQFIKYHGDHPRFVKSYDNPYLTKSHFMKAHHNKPHFIKFGDDKPQFIRSDDDNPYFVNPDDDDTNFIKSDDNKPEFLRPHDNNPYFATSNYDKPYFILPDDDNSHLRKSDNNKPQFIRSDDNNPYFATSNDDKSHFILPDDDNSHLRKTDYNNPRIINPDDDKEQTIKTHNNQSPRNAINNDDFIKSDDYNPQFIKSDDDNPYFVLPDDDNSHFINYNYDNPHFMKSGDDQHFQTKPSLHNPQNVDSSSSSRRHTSLNEDDDTDFFKRQYNEDNKHFVTRKYFVGDDDRTSLNLNTKNPDDTTVFSSRDNVMAGEDNTNFQKRFIRKKDNYDNTRYTDSKSLDDDNARFINMKNFDNRRFMQRLLVSNDNPLARKKKTILGLDIEDMAYVHKGAKKPEMKSILGLEKESNAPVNQNLHGKLIRQRLNRFRRNANSKPYGSINRHKRSTLQDNKLAVEENNIKSRIETIFGLDNDDFLKFRAMDLTDLKRLLNKRETAVEVVADDEETEDDDEGGDDIAIEYDDDDKKPSSTPESSDERELKNVNRIKAIELAEELNENATKNLSCKVTSHSFIVLLIFNCLLILF